MLDVVEESGCTYSKLKEALVGRVRYRLRDLELKLFAHCGTMDKLKLLMVKGLFCTQLSVMEQGVINATKVEKLSDLGDIASSLRDSCSRTSSRPSRQETKCYRCQQLGHRSFECTAKPVSPVMFATSQGTSLGVAPTRPLGARAMNLRGVVWQQGGRRECPYVQGQLLKLLRVW